MPCTDAFLEHDAAPPSLGPGPAVWDGTDSPQGIFHVPTSATSAITSHSPARQQSTGQRSRAGVDQTNIRSLHNNQHFLAPLPPPSSSFLLFFLFTFSPFLCATLHLCRVRTTRRCCCQRPNSPCVQMQPNASPRLPPASKMCTNGNVLLVKWVVVLRPKEQLLPSSSCTTGHRLQTARRTWGMR